MILIMFTLILLGYLKTNNDKTDYNDYPLQNVFIERVIDGDTFQANGSKFRLLGINTPEKNERFYLEAKDFLKGFEGNNSFFEFYGTDKYGRSLGYLHFNGLLINKEIISRGFASSYYYGDDKYKSSILSAESLARLNNLGLWQKSVNVCGRCIIISELDKGGSDDDCKSGSEFVKIKNSCNLDCDISGWLIKDSATHIYIFKNKTNILFNEELILYNGKGKDNPEDNLLFFNNKPIGSCYSLWNDDGDNVFLRDDKGLLVDFYRY